MHRILYGPFSILPLDSKLHTNSICGSNMVSMPTPPSETTQLFKLARGGSTQRIYPASSSSRQWPALVRQNPRLEFAVKQLSHRKLNRFKGKRQETMIRGLTLEEVEPLAEHL
jgi:hypothetical protein